MIEKSQLVSAQARGGMSLKYPWFSFGDFAKK
jgi:hypothetical protein